MKNYVVTYDITMSGEIKVEAEDEESAKKIARERIKEEPFYFAAIADSHLETKTPDVRVAD